MLISAVVVVSNPWEVQTRTVLAEALYGRHRPATDRAIDVVVNQLRKKLDPIGESARDLILIKDRVPPRLPLRQ